MCRQLLDYDNFFASMVFYSRKNITRAESIASAGTMADMVRNTLGNDPQFICVVPTAVKTAHDLDVPMIFVLTETGSTARAVAKYKPAMPVLTFTKSEQTARQALVSSVMAPGRLICHTFIPS